MLLIPILNLTSTVSFARLFLSFDNYCAAFLPTAKKNEERAQLVVQEAEDTKKERRPKPIDEMKRLLNRNAARVYLVHIITTAVLPTKYGTVVPPRSRYLVYISICFFRVFWVWRHTERWWVIVRGVATPLGGQRLLRGTIVNRTCGIHKNLYIQQFIPTKFGPINCGPLDIEVNLTRTPPRGDRIAALKDHSL